MLKIFSSASYIRHKTQQHLESYSRPTVDFFVLMACSSAIISSGLILDNPAIIIGGMVVAPLITPFFGFSLNIILFRWSGILHTLISILIGSSIAIVLSMLVGQFTTILSNEVFTTTSEIIERTHPDMLYFVVAIISGFVGTFAYARPNLSEKIVGIAISAAVVPPLSVIGLGVAKLDHAIIQSSTLLFLLNLGGIILGSILMFIILGFGKHDAIKE